MIAAPLASSLLQNSIVASRVGSNLRHSVKNTRKVLVFPLIHMKLGACEVGQSTGVPDFADDRQRYVAGEHRHHFTDQVMILQSQI